MLHVSPISRGAGRTATGAAAYRAGERLRDERTGELYNYTGRQDVLHKEIVLPSRVVENAPAWSLDREQLWNAAERAESRRDSRVAREYLVALPHELNPDQHIALAGALSREIAERYGVVVDSAIHAPRAGGDPRNFHLHLLTTTREITAAGLGGKTGLDLGITQRHERGLVNSIQEFGALRARTAELVNEALQAANLLVRVDHRTLAAQGISREPQAHLPWGAWRDEKRGLYSEIAERVRGRYRERVEARSVKSHSADAQSTEAGIGEGQVLPARSSLEDIQRRAREDWLQLRAAQGQASGQGAEHHPDLSKGREDDLAL
ncbi:MAG TPA: MobA/MobL family protein [Steroidobacteraceae bacterium]|nr:MobA/MobL family protein [Steroidobacteraceae bacterium]